MSTVHQPGRPRHDPPPTGHPSTAAPDERPSPTGGDRYRAAVTGIAPAFLLLAIVYHPPLGDLRDKQAVSELVSDTTRWTIAHLMVGVAAAAVVLAFLAVDTYLRRGTGTRLTAVGVPFVVVGSVLFAFLPAMEIAMLAVREVGADVEAVMVEMDTWFLPTLVASSFFFGVGALLFAVAVARSRVLSPGIARLVTAAFVVAVLARFVPFGAALYVMAAALLVALLPVALAMLERPVGATRT